MAEPSTDLSQMRHLIPAMNRLQNALSAIGADAADISLPRIVVVGAQSSGKSSVLEALVGRDFLPRNAGICTRRPLILMLVHTPVSPSTATANAEWGEFLHRPSERFEDFDAIRAEIEAETNRVVGGDESKAVSSDPITLSIHSPHVVKLTLVDLPGLTRVPVEGQPVDTATQIEAMVCEFIQHEDSIILAVSAANADLANSDALRLAKTVDPNYERTLGVITKLDLMDEGTNARRVLDNEIIPLALGFIGVVNRSQADIVAKKRIAEAVSAERAFFTDTAAYTDIADACGIAFLGTRLNALLLKHIHATLPALRKRVRDGLEAARDDVHALGDPLPNDVTSQATTILRLLTTFANAFSQLTEGTVLATTKELCGGARVAAVFQNSFKSALADIDPCEGLSEADIRTAIANAAGLRGSLFNLEVSFSLLVERAIQQLRTPCAAVIDAVHEELLTMLVSIRVPALDRYTLLRDRILETARTVFTRARASTHTLVTQLVDMESYINTSHPDFISALPGAMPRNSRLTQASSSSTAAAATAPFFASAEYASASYEQRDGQVFPYTPQAGEATENGVAPQQQQQQHSTEENHTSSAANNDTDLVKHLVRSYFSIVVTKVHDNVLKGTSVFLVRECTERLHEELVRELFSTEHFAKLLEEPDDVVQRRVTAAKRLRVFQEAKTSLDGMPSDVAHT